MRLRDKTAIITGGLGGQGQAEVRLFLLDQQRFDLPPAFGGHAVFPQSYVIQRPARALLR